MGEEEKKREKEEGNEGRKKGRAKVGPVVESRADPHRLRPTAQSAGLRYRMSQFSSSSQQITTIK